jgi:hypothetical protein
MIFFIVFSLSLLVTNGSAFKSVANSLSPAYTLAILWGHNNENRHYQQSNRLQASYYGILCMNIPGAFQTIAEISIGLAGFSGLLVALRRSTGPLSGVQKYRMRILFALSFGALFLSLMPEMMLYLEVNDDSLWIYCSFAMTVCSIGFLYWWIATSRRIAQMYPEIFHWRAVSTMATGHALNLTLQVVVVLSLTDSRHAGIFLVGLTWYLMHASQQFIRMLFIQPDELPDAQR